MKQLDAKAKQLRARKIQQLGDLVVAVGADTLTLEVLAGALLAAVDTKESSAKEAWRKRGASFFQRTSHGRSGAGGNSRGATESPGDAASARDADRP
ncbi:conjugal transfer protein TraD [Sphingomonas sp. LM7]|uniref:conjugal transfer protein TraD n=1 Tax=Sphingomonas sp. LM7 TaxID=1938607 RepID=UPI003457E8D2